MARQQKGPNVVAELGRPETAGETAARKAENSRLYRERKTVNNLVFSLLVTLALVVVIVLIVPRGTGGFEDHSVDVAQLAQEAAPDAGRTLAAPAVPASWKAKSAELHQADGVAYWQINYTTVDEATGAEAYAAVVQAFTADGSPVNEKWISSRLENQKQTGEERLGDVDWFVYDHSDRNPDRTNVLFGLAGSHGPDALLVYGTDTPATLRVLATQVVDSLAGSAPQNPSEEAQ